MEREGGRCYAVRPTTRRCRMINVCRSHGISTRTRRLRMPWAHYAHDIEPVTADIEVTGSRGLAPSRKF